MFCSQCGKQIKDGSKFCQYCGSVQEIDQRNSNQSTEKINNSAKNSPRGIVAGLSVLDLCIGILYIIITARWLYLFWIYMKDTWYAFDFIDSDMRLLLMLLYILPLGIVVLLCGIGMTGIRQHRYYISIGGIIAVVGLIVKIGMFIFSDISFDTWEATAYRIFNVYGNIGIFTVIFGVLTSALVYVKANEK